MSIVLIYLIIGFIYSILDFAFILYIGTHSKFDDEVFRDLRETVKEYKEDTWGHKIRDFTIAIVIVSIMWPLAILCNIIAACCHK